MPRHESLARVRVCKGPRRLPSDQFGEILEVGFEPGRRKDELSVLTAPGSRLTKLLVLHNL